MIYKVGEKYPQFRGDDGLFLNYDEGGFMLLCRMASPTPKEKAAFQSGQALKIGMGRYGCVVYWTVGFGDLPMMDCTYCPMIGMPPELKAINDPYAGYALSVMLADASTGELLNIRAIGLPHDFSVQANDEIATALMSEIPYQQSLNRIYQYSTKQLHKMATAVANVR